MWLTDRSRYLLGLQHCQMARYLEYHAGPYGYGYRKVANSLPLATGTYIHQAIEGILRLAKVDGKVPPRQAIRPIIAKAAADYRLDVSKSGLSGVSDQAQVDYLMAEQSHLTEALTWCWVNSMLPVLMDEFEILEIEREETYPVTPCTCGAERAGHERHREGWDGPDESPCGRILQMSRPDIVTKRKKDGKVGIHDFKTSYTVSEGYVDQFRDSVQMAVGTLGVERRLGVEVDHYYIHVLVKGGRGVFRNRGRESPGKRQYSHLCYAQVHSPNPPITQQTTWETKGLWIDKTPIWEAYFSQKPGDESNAEFWVDSISLEIKNESIAFIGPYTKQAHMIPQYLRSVEGEEKRWLARLWKLYDIEQKYGWKSKQFQDALDHEVPRSYQCNDLYGERCPYYRLCFKEPGWEDPIGTGEYAHRIPNHLAEKEQLERMLKG